MPHVYTHQFRAVLESTSRLKHPPSAIDFEDVDIDAYFEVRGTYSWLQVLVMNQLQPDYLHLGPLKFGCNYSYGARYQYPGPPSRDLDHNFLFTYLDHPMHLY